MNDEEIDNWEFMMKHRNQQCYYCAGWETDCHCNEEPQIFKKVILFRK